MPDYYPDENPQSESAPKSKYDSPDRETFLTSKSILGGKDAEVGSEWMFRIVHVYDDEIEWEYATEEKKPDSKSAMSESEDSLKEMAGMKE